MKAIRVALRSSALLALGTLMLACSPEEKAEKVFEKYENAFAECKKITEEVGADPGTHYCTKITSMALEMSLDDTGIDKGTRDEMISGWVGSNPLGKFYADETAREAIQER
ncbi:hypothetical protein ENSA5_52650 [Enhygromyxa salina]|uniref:Lipoprotein n=1 Tax=Enhygromyxa salina TaxID=215803 RepID=A0A2S9XG65_9BACT|nr:hypothetical protein [Enhygromyxa salina]PRP91827.1 hypothetical protein ENSA5_52650 [Enhygromyxa salina]